MMSLAMIPSRSKIFKLVPEEPCTNYSDLLSEFVNNQMISPNMGGKRIQENWVQLESCQSWSTFVQLKPSVKMVIITRQ